MKSILPAVIAAVLVMGMVGTQAQQLQKVTLNYPTRSGASWPLFIAREGGYYEKQGLDAYYELLKLVEGKSILLEEYARDQIAAEEMHLADIRKMMRKPGSIK